MEVKVPRDIMKYEEALFFGLSMRQFIFSALSCAIAVVAFLIANPLIGTEMASWVCIIAALPFALMAFLKYNGMTAEVFAKTWIRSEILFPKVLVYRSSNFYMDAIEAGRTEELSARHRNKGDADVKAKKGKERKTELSAAKVDKRQREKDFESRSRNIYKYRRRRNSIR